MHKKNLVVEINCSLTHTDKCWTFVRPTPVTLTTPFHVTAFAKQKKIWH